MRIEDVLELYGDSIVDKDIYIAEINYYGEHKYRDIPPCKMQIKLGKKLTQERLTQKLENKPNLYGLRDLGNAFLFARYKTETMLVAKSNWITNQGKFANANSQLEKDSLAFFTTLEDAEHYYQKRQQEVTAVVEAELATYQEEARVFLEHLSK